MQAPSMQAHQSLTGQFLLATVALHGTPFQDRIVLVTERSENGTLGLVVNHAVHMPLEEVFTSVKTEGRKPQTFFMGGPVQESRMSVLEVGKTIFRMSRQFAPGLFWTLLPPEAPIPVSALFGTPTTRAFLGFSAWSPGQLEEEISSGAWELSGASSLGLFARDRNRYPVSVDEFKERYAAHTV